MSIILSVTNILLKVPIIVANLPCSRNCKVWMRRKEQNRWRSITIILMYSQMKLMVRILY